MEPGTTEPGTIEPVTDTPIATVRYFAGARAAAGRSEESVPAATLDRLIADVSARHGHRLATVLSVSSFLVDGVACHDRHATLHHGATVDVLPPFAGG